MNHSEQRLSEARRQHTEALVTRHLHQLFPRLPMLSGFWLRPDLEVAELSVFTWPGYTAGADLYEAVMQSLVELAEEHPRGGATHARAHLCTRGALMRPKKASLLSRAFARVVGALARFLAEPVRRPAATHDVLALSGLLCAGDVLLTEGNTRAAALVRRLTRSPWAHVSIYVGPLEAGDDPPCVVEAEIAAGVRAVPLSQFKGQRSRIVRPLALTETDRQCLADWLVGRIGDPYDLALACALCLCCLKLPAPRTMVQDATRFICSSLLVQAFLVVGHPIAISQARSVVPRDFESAAGFEVVM